VLDFSTLLPGPMATLLLAEAGAEVIKIERPGAGEDMRHYAPRWGRDSVNFALLNRGKKSLALDLKDEGHHARAELLDHASLEKVNPRLIYCSITGYGQDGPKRDVAGHDLNYIGDAGLLSLSMGPPESPVVPPALIADIAGGAYPAVMNILLALQERARTGRGRRLDVAMAENLFPFMYWALGNGLARGEWPGNGADLVTGGSPRYRLYPTADARMVAAAPLEEKFWGTFCEIIGLPPHLRDDTRDPAATMEAVAAIIAREPGAAWARLFAGRDCCCTVVASVAEALEDPHFRARGVFDHVLVNEDGGSIPALPVPVAPAFRAKPGTPLAAPPLGANDEDYR
ncbi:MAG TPA: CaiB/BaiF CoA-transferase family protein, partial [Beijerinckiaceae bacterium]|nr:CaiB/BaiF CoA-transferase family protein [Beijerinckiaceae bacterium]